MFQVNTNEPHLQKVHIGSGYGLVPEIKQQAITQSNVDLDLCHYMVPLGHNELIYGSCHQGGAVFLPGFAII